MHPLLAGLTEGMTFVGRLPEDVAALLEHHGCGRTAAHSAAVARVARELAVCHGVDAGRAERAGWLHDVSAVFRNTERLGAARALGLEILPEEAAAPAILHQKLSAAVAQEVFGERDEEVLWAVRCHTTLRPMPGPLDLVVFAADKWAWDQEGAPPYGAEMERALGASLEGAAAVYLRYLWDRRGDLAVIHPWMRAAYRELCERSGR